MADAVTAVASRAQFNQAVLDSDIPVLVNFSGINEPSRQMDRAFAKLAAEYSAQKVRFVSVDTSVGERLAADFQIRPEITPTVMLFNGGREIRRWGNEQNLTVYRKELDALVAALWGTPPATE